MSLFINLLKDSKNKKKIGSFEWSEDTEIIFFKFKEFFTITFILVHFNSELRNQIEINALRYVVIEIYT